MLFLTHRVDLLMDITKRLGKTPVSSLWKKKPNSITDIPLVQVGFWLRLESPISQFSSKVFILEHEQRLARLNWAKFEDVTGKPDCNEIKSAWKLPIGDAIGKYLQSHEDDIYDRSTDTIKKLSDAMLSHGLQKQMCAWLNEQELRRVTDQISSLSGHDDILISMRREFLESCRTLLNDWFAGTGMPIPQMDSVQKKKSLKRQFEELFDWFWNDPTADPIEVQRVLGDEIRWKNPSQYLHQTKRKRDLTTEELKQRPGFAWIDPKGTSKN